MKHLEIKNPFSKRNFLDNRVKNYLKILQNVAALVTFQNRPSALRRKENVEFLEEQFHNEKLSFAHKKKTKLSFELFQ